MVQPFSSRSSSRLSSRIVDVPGTPTVSLGVQGLDDGLAYIGVVRLPNGYVFFLHEIHGISPFFLVLSDITVYLFWQKVRWLTTDADLQKRD
jgi:hypothetical protein